MMVCCCTAYPPAGARVDHSLGCLDECTDAACRRSHMNRNDVGCCTACSPASVCKIPMRTDPSSPNAPYSDRVKSFDVPADFSILLHKPSYSKQVLRLGTEKTDTEKRKIQETLWLNSAAVLAKH